MRNQKILRELFDKIATQLESLRQKNDEIQEEEFSNVLVLVIDEEITRKPRFNTEDTKNLLEQKLSRNENFCDIYGTYYFRDQDPKNKDWIILNKRKESQKNVKIF